MSNFPDLSSHGFRVVRELGHNRSGGRVTYLAIPDATASLHNKKLSESSPLTQGEPLAHRHQQRGVKQGAGKKPVVIKQFQFALGNTHWSDYEAIEREIQVLQGLNHPGIPRCFGSFQTPTGFCLVQEYKKAPSLAAPRSFDPDEIKQIAVSLLNILIYLQNRIPTISHRDIKPENILVDEKINVFLVDFGLARIGDSEVAMSSVAKGTIGFMAPEQLFNRQLSEASDLYGLGATLICLLTGTPSTAISNLIDDDYRINFKHLVPKLSLRWIEWLEKMVELKPKNRFPDAATALEALQPIYVMRVPEAKFNHSCLEFTATKLGEKLTQTLTITNSVPETVLESRLQVASHLSDPPHTPHVHEWIQFDQSHFVSNQALCKITVDTRKLMANRTFEREVLIHTNSQPETQILKIKVKTAPVPIAAKKLPYFSLSLLVLFAAAATWFEATAWEGIVSKNGSLGMAIAIFVSAFVAILGLAAAVTSEAISQLVAKIRTRLGVRLKAMDTVAAVFFAGVAAMFVARFGADFREMDTASTWGLLRFMPPLRRWMPWYLWQPLRVKEWLKVACSEDLVKRSPFGVSLLSTALGISLGLGFKLGFVHQLVTSAIVGTSVPLATMILYPSLERAKRIANYRKLEGHLIKP
jgi:serine/threonine protein kinase